MNEAVGMIGNNKIAVPIGMDISKSITLNCADCGQKLAEIVVTETNEMREQRGLSPLFTKFKVDKCYSCDGSSFTTEELSGSVFAGSLKDNYEVDVLDTDVEHEYIDNSASKIKNIILTTLTIRKKKNG